MLYILRHGQTDWNLTDKLQGQTDTYLNENGKESARAAKEKYKDVNIDYCFASPLHRAYETACIIMEGRNIEVVKDDRLKEMCFGGYEGGCNHPKDHSDPVYLFYNDPTHYIPDDRGESFDDVTKRTHEFLIEKVIPLLKENKDILIVGHGAMNLSIINQFYHVPLVDFWKYFMGNCEMVEIDTSKESL